MSHKQKPKISASLLTIACGLQILIIPQLGTKLLAEPLHLAQKPNLGITFVPPKDAKPANSAGGASRGARQCLELGKNPAQLITPLVPKTHQSLTVKSHPSLLIFVPEVGQGTNQAFFSIKDENNKQYYQTVLSIPEQPGIIQVALPENVPELETGRSYKWSFVVMCHNRLRPDSPLIEGRMERVELNSQLRQQIQQASPEKAASLYGRAGIWHETINTLAELRKARPEDESLKATWQNLLTSVGLEKIAHEELIN